MRPLLDLQFFADLPKFLWFDNGDGGDGSSGSGGDASGGDAGSPGSASAGPSGQGGTATGAPAGMGVSGEAAAPAGTSATAPGTGPGTGTATADAGFGGQGGSPGGVSGGVAASVGAGPGGAASGGAAPGGAGGTAGSSTSGGGTGGPGAATGAGGGATGGPGAATGGGGGTAAGGSGISASVRAALQNLLGGNPADALRGAVRNSAIDFGPPGVPSLGVPEGVGGQGAAPRGTVSVSSLGPPGPNLAQLAQQLFGSPQAQAARSSISADTGDEFGPTNTTKGTGSSTATAANTNAAPNFGGKGFGSGSPAAPSLSIGPGGIGSDAVAGGSSPNAAPGTPSLSIGPGGIGADVNAGQGVSTYGDMSDARGFGGTKGVGDPGAAGSSAVGTPATTTALGGGPGNASESPTGPSAAAPSFGGQGFGGSTAPAVALGGGPGNASESPTGTPAAPAAVTGLGPDAAVSATVNSPTSVPGLSPQNQALMDQIQAAVVQNVLNYAGVKFGPPQREGQPRALSNAPPEAFTLPNASPQQPSSLQQLIQSLVSGGAPGPGLSSLAQNAQFGI
jgi:hypothetical protein